MLARIRPIRSAIVAMKRQFSLPSHNVVGMPSLSPTMTAGIIGKWLKSPGDRVNAGDSIAEIETDKASMAFEAQDEFIIAKLLVSTGVEIAVGQPIMITVEDTSSVAAFANYLSPATAVSVEAAKPPSPVQQPVVTQVPSPVMSSALPAPAPVPVPVPVPTPTPTPVPATSPVSSSVKPVELSPAFLSSPLGTKLKKDREAYIARYGRTGHVATTITVDKAEKSKK